MTLIIPHPPSFPEQLIATLEEEDIAGYGVDWDVNDDPHLLENNLLEFPAEDPFRPQTTPQ
jgi:hypothetical protein